MFWGATHPLRVLLAIVAMFSGIYPAAQGQDPQDPKTLNTLSVEKDRFAINGTPTFLLGISYYAGLGASEDAVQRDLDELHKFGFNWLRVWATWDSHGENVSALDERGNGREPYLRRLQSLVAECDQRGMIVDVTLARSKPSNGKRESVHLPDLESHRQAIRTIIKALKPHRNWYLDLANERDVGDDRFVPVEELKQLRQLAREVDPQLPVTASFGGHDLTKSDVGDAIQTVGADFLAVHRPRRAGSPRETEAKTREVRAMLAEMQLVAPIQQQEPFRRGYTDWEPTADDFLTDLKGAIQGGAAGWCFHNGSTKGTADGEPRRSFDLRLKRLIEQLDIEEQKVLRGAKDAVKAAEGE